MHVRSGRRLAWLATLGATAVSTYALDAVATAAGLALLAAGSARRGRARAADRVPRPHVRRLGGGPARQPRGQLAAAERDRGEHERPLEGRLRARAAPERAGPPARGRRRLRPDRAAQGGAVLLRRVRCRARHGLRLGATTRSSSWAARTWAPPRTSTASAARPSPCCGAGAASPSCRQATRSGMGKSRTKRSTAARSPRVVRGSRQRRCTCAPRSSTSSTSVLTRRGRTACAAARAWRPPPRRGRGARP